MASKLTLSVEERVVKRAKSYAKKTGRSLSELVQSYLEKLTESEGENTELSPKLKRLLGIIKLPKDFDEDAEKRNYLEKKYR